MMEGRALSRPRSATTERGPPRLGREVVSPQSRAENVPSCWARPPEKLGSFFQNNVCAPEFGSFRRMPRPAGRNRNPLLGKAPGEIGFVFSKTPSFDLSSSLPLGPDRFVLSRNGATQRTADDAVAASAGRVRPSRRGGTNARSPDAFVVSPTAHRNGFSCVLAPLGRTLRADPPEGGGQPAHYHPTRFRKGVCPERTLLSQTNRRSAEPRSRQCAKGRQRRGLRQEPLEKTAFGNRAIYLTPLQSISSREKECHARNPSRIAIPSQELDVNTNASGVVKS